MAKVALLIGVSEYESGLDGLPAAVNDVIALQQVLVHPEMGNFAESAVTVLPNPDRQTMETAIYHLFADRQKDDLVLLYFSGHGVLDQGREFYLGSRSTCKTQVPPTAVAARSIQYWLAQSRSQHKVIILDSCFSGAFARGVQAKDGGSVNPAEFLGGQGTAILTAATSTQYALTQPGLDLSVYTHYLVEGIRTGGADQNEDGWIDLEELHAYTSSKVKEAAPAMTPEFYPFKEGYKIRLARSPQDDPRLKYRKLVEQKLYQGKFTIPARRLLNSQRLQWNLDPAVADAIEAEVLQPYRDYQRKLQEYEQTLVEALQAEPTLSQRTLDDLKDYQQHLALLDADVLPIETQLLGNSLPIAATDALPPTPSLPTFTFDIITVNHRGEETHRQPGQAGYFTEDLGNGVTLDMVAIPGGQFQMGTAAANREIQESIKAGSGEQDAQQRVSWETPQHPVMVPPFWIGRYPVTQAQYAAIMGTNPSKFKEAQHPVEQVSWDEAVAFCDRLSQRTGKPYRLPSEAEWEYACRAGTSTPFYFGDTITPDLVNYDGNSAYGDAPKGSSRQQTTAVGSFPTNAFGLCDLHGNVWEWCADPWHDSYDRAPADGSVWVLDSDRENDLRLLRGGSWVSYPRYCRSAIRNRSGRNGRYKDVGFRLVSAVPGAL